MKRWAWVVAVAVGMAAWTQAGFGDTPPERGKYLVILQAGKESHEGMARAVHAFLYASELKEHGHEVVLVFDDGGVPGTSQHRPVGGPGLRDPHPLRHQNVVRAPAITVQSVSSSLPFGDSTTGAWKDASSSQRGVTYWTPGAANSV